MHDSRPLYKRGKFMGLMASAVTLIALVALAGALDIAIPDLVLIALSSAFPAFMGAQGVVDAKKAEAFGRS